MWGALIGAGVSLIGGALNRRSQRKQEDRYLQQMTATAAVEQTQSDDRIAEYNKQADERLAAQNAREDKLIAEANARADKKASADQRRADKRTAAANAREDERTAAYNADLDRRTAEYNADQDRRTAEHNADLDRRAAEQNKLVDNRIKRQNKVADQRWERDQEAIDTRAAQEREVMLGDRAEQRAYNEGREASRFSDLREAAVSAGFNPLTALGGNFLPGGESGFLSTGIGGALGRPAPLSFNHPVFTTPTQSSQAMATPVMSSHSQAPIYTSQHQTAQHSYRDNVLAPYLGLPDPVMGQAIDYGSAFSQFGSALADELTGDAARRREGDALRNDVLRLERERTQQLIDSGVNWGAPAMSGIGVNAGFPRFTSAQFPGPEDFGAQIDGYGMPYNPGTTDAGRLEERYGDVIGSVAGAGVLASDGLYWWRNSRLGSSVINAGRAADGALSTGFGLLSSWANGAADSFFGGEADPDYPMPWAPGDMFNPY